MTHAERQTAYRKRQREAVMTAYGKPAGQPTAAILGALSRLLAQLDDPGKANQHDTVRFMAQQGMRELCQRYGLHPESSPVTKARKSSR